MAIVETSYGRLRGSDLDGVLRFRGIPFARPPVGDLRWRPPQLPERSRCPFSEDIAHQDA